MYDYTDIFLRIKRNFHYYKGDAVVRSGAMQLLRILQAICNILKREGIRKVYRYQKRNEHMKHYSAENPLNTVNVTL